MSKTPTTHALFVARAVPAVLLDKHNQIRQHYYFAFVWTVASASADTMSYSLETSNRKTLVAAASFLVFAFPLVFRQQLRAQTVTEHPYIEPKDIKSETCLGCHPDKKEGKFVHSAVASGCETCHQATSEKEKEETTVTLVAQGGKLCAI